MTYPLLVGEVLESGTLTKDSQLTWALAYYRQNVCLSLASFYNFKFYTDYLWTVELNLFFTEILCFDRPHQGFRVASVDKAVRNPGGGGGGYLTKFCMGRLRPEVQPLTLSYTILAEKVPLLYTFYR